MNIKSLSQTTQKFNHKLNQDYPSDKKERIFARTIKVSEEFGEFSNEILAYFGKQRPEKLDKMNPEENLQKEWADVVLTLFTIANEMNWDVDQVLQNKINYINKRMKIKQNQDLIS